ncbi:glycine--tRNA ligase subunit beta [Dokdonella koreensis]|uniref:Glycine--tRNA ligase beta subunit n=1 Tax=Dokdonella koreensis DS-123 TaxID=1300342 RepID=A0A160DY56_9GAMM|nr:glycine--tRNA ligase subunit beta [Dokdonella koreensis]ANB19697.1 Glycine-tRNA ligase beta subunit [Dokdonella koreensis DS-123]
MTTTASLLVELGTEELPPRALDDLAAAFAGALVEGLAKRGVAADAAGARTYCSPRRLAAWIPAVATTQPDQVVERRGPALAAGLDATGQPTRALVGFAQSCGVEVAALEKLETDKGAWFVHRAEKKGQPTAALVQAVLEDALKALPIPKPMRWGGHDYSFVRPAHWLVVLHGSEVVDAAVLGLRSGRQSRGHRFHHPQPVHVADADAWLDALRAAKVLADPAERRARVRAEVARAGRDTGGEPRLSDALLEEIANLTEWPVAIGCAFERAFLEVPAEALVTTMEANQKFVPVFDGEARLTEHFIGVANIESKDPAEIRKGYERVIRPRFADAKFFFDEDRKQPLAAYQGALEAVTYQQQLGSVWSKVVRVAELARVIANRTGVDAGLATRAAALSKCDLMTRMVGEFPELQGVMGRYYATAGGENAAVAAALDEVYAPRFAGDAIAAGQVGRVLAIAERLDTLAGIFTVGLKPSGNKDPFALRRAALGLARTLIEGELELDLKAQLAEALALLPETAFAVKDATPGSDAGIRRDVLAAELYDFILDRLRGYYADQGIPGEAFEAVRVLAPASLLDFDRRLRAVVAFASLPEAEALAAANKRIGNILKQAGFTTQAGYAARADDPPAQSALRQALDSAGQDYQSLLASRDYVGVLRTLATLRDVVDRFFADVMVMAEDADVRHNRLALLSNLRVMFLRVADISLLQRG